MFDASWSQAESQNEASQMFRTKEQVESFVKNEIPIGTARDQVTAVLKRYGIVNTYVPRDRMIGAIIKDVKKSFLFLISESIQMKFYFNENDRLQSYSVESVYTGP
jgi:hypothetical protein